MTTLANLDVYLQAVGGKYLGPNAYQTRNIHVTLRYGIHTVPIPYNPSGSTDDGTVNTTFSDGSSSPFPILKQPPTPGNPTVYYLTPGTNPIKASITVPLADEYNLGSLEVKVPTPFGPDLVINSFLILDRSQTTYRVTIPVHGLLLEPVPIPEGPTNLALLVKMMCGCPITGDGTKFWPDYDFAVFADVRYEDGTSETLPMKFAGSAESFYTVSTSSGRGGVKQVYFTATQKSTGNYGYGKLFK